MPFPTTRLRRLRKNQALRSMVRENRVHPSNLIMPLFIVPGSQVNRPIGAMPGQANISIDIAAQRAVELREAGIQSVLLFAIPETKDDSGSAAWDPNGIIQKAIPAIKKAVPDMLVVTDLCFCEYTSHGHCGIMHNGNLDNDATIEIIVKQTLSHAAAGADIIAPSGMIDGAVGAMRRALDAKGFSMTPIMAYAAKMASGFYGPFREAVQSAPQYGDRKSYQMDPANIKEALREVALDIEEGADMVMVKPGLPCLDIIYAVKEHFGLPTAAYQVSGEYSMLKAAAANGWLDEKRVMIEMLTALKRAGADIIISYFSEEFAKLHKQGLTEY